VTNSTFYLDAWALEGEGRRALPFLDFENFSKKGCFLSLEQEQPNFIAFALFPLERCRKIPWWPSLGKNPSNAHARMMSHDGRQTKIIFQK